MEKPHILLTNDDGIDSPGLWAAARQLSQLGYVHVVAPREQHSGAGRSMPVSADGEISPRTMQVDRQEWTVYAVGGTPAQAVLHAVLEILPRLPDLVVSGINYGENLGSGVTISGTVGGALEAASHSIPALAVSLETEAHLHLTHSTEVDFSTAAYFTGYFARRLLARPLPPDVDVLKVDVPSHATPETPWEVTFLSRRRYYEALPPSRQTPDQPGKLGYRQDTSLDQYPPGSDVHAVRVRRVVSVTPLSLDLTSRIPLEQLASLLRQEQ